MLASGCTNLPGTSISMLGRIANRMSDQPLQICRSTRPQPTLTGGKDKFRMVFGDIPQVVGNTAADVKRCIILQRFEDGQCWPWVCDKGRNALPPGEPRACPLAAEAPYMRVGVDKPMINLLQRAPLLLNQKRADGELRGEPFGQGTQGQHRDLKRVFAAVVSFILPVFRNEEAVGKIEETSRPQVICIWFLRRQRRHEDSDRLLVVPRQEFVKRLGDVQASLHDG